jgi:hypothetical protein
MMAFAPVCSLTFSRVRANQRPLAFTDRSLLWKEQTMRAFGYVYFLPLISALVLSSCGPTLHLNRLEEIQASVANATATAQGHTVVVAGTARSLSTLQPSQLAVAAPSDKQKLDEASAKLDVEFAKMLAECHDVLSSFETTARGFQWGEFTIAIIGSISGAVVAPALTTASAVGNKVWSSAFSGVSGAANTAQASMRELGLSSREALLTRQAIRNDMKDALDAYFAKDASIDQRSLAIQKATVACVNYALTVPDANITPK